MAVTDAVRVMRRGEMVRTVRDHRDQPGGARRADGRPAGAAAGREGAGDAGRRRCSRSRSLVVDDELGVTRSKSVSSAVRGRRDRRHRRGGRQRPVGTARGAARHARPASGTRSPQGQAPLARRRSPAPTAPRRRRARARARGPPAHGAGRAVRGMGKRHASATSTTARFARAVMLDWIGRRSRGCSRGVDREVRHPAADRATEDRELFRRQPAENRARARDGARLRTCCSSGSRPAGSTSARSSSSTSRSSTLREPGQGDPAGLGRARRDQALLATGSS